MGARSLLPNCRTASHCSCFHVRQGPLSKSPIADDTALTYEASHASAVSQTEGVWKGRTGLHVDVDIADIRLGEAGGRITIQGATRERSLSAAGTLVIDKHRVYPLGSFQSWGRSGRETRRRMYLDLMTSET